MDDRCLDTLASLKFVVSFCLKSEGGRGFTNLA